MITSIRFVSFTVTDLDQAVDFYVNRLGFSLRVQMPLPGGNQFVMVAPPGGGTSLVFSLPMPGRTHTPTSGVSFETGDVQSTYEDLQAQGVEFTRPPAATPWGGVEAVFADPSGNSFMLQEGGL
ncbi:MAG TPA: VOC family protein [Anaerolineaceae bacterium]